jgi:hypothetical protein
MTVAEFAAFLAKNNIEIVSHDCNRPMLEFRDDSGWRATKRYIEYRDWIASGLPPTPQNENHPR